MTAEEKRDRRKARHELQAQFQGLVKQARRCGLFSTNRQLDAGAKILTDRYLKEVLTPAASRIEAQVVAEAQGRAESQGA